MAETTDKNNSSNETGDFADISKRDSLQPVVASTSIAPDSGEGSDTTSNEITKESSHVEPNLTEMDTRTDDLSKSECTEKGSEGLDDSKDLELQWEEDDENNTTLDNDAYKIDDDLENKLLEETEQNDQDVSTESKKETEAYLEEKCLQAPINSMVSSENQEQDRTEVDMELNEGELLLEGQPEDTEAMDVDDDKDSETENESMKNILVDGKLIKEVHSVTDIRVTQSPRSNDDYEDNDQSIEVDVSTEDSVKVTHGFSKPDVMLEIPTQEIDINDLPDSPNDEENDESMEETHNTSEEVTGPSFDNPEPSTSTELPKMTPDLSEKAQEATDCLGLLAESSRVMDEDDDDDGDADDDDDEDFDQDESSNQMTAENSEDSNAPYSETEPARGDDTSEPQDLIKIETEDKTISNDVSKQTEATNEPQESITDEKNDKIVLTCDINEEDSTSQDNVEKDKEDNFIPTCVAEEIESESQEKEDSTISKEKDDASISPNDLTKENEDNVASTCVTTEKDSTAPQNNTNREEEGTVLSEETEKLQEETVQSEEDAVQPDSTVQSVDPANKEKEPEIPFGVTIKTEKEDSTKRRRPIEIVKKYIETRISDDVIEQVLEIETVKISDDEDDEPENLEKESDKTATASEKNTKAEEVAALEETIAIQKSTDPAVVVETSAAPEKPPEVEKPDEVDDAVINLIPEKTNAEESHTTDSSTTSHKSSRMKKLTVSTVPNTSIISVVELGESSSEDDIQEVSKGSPPDHSVSHLQKLLDSEFKPPPLTSMTTVNIPTGIDIMSTSGIGGNRTQIVTKEGEVVISGVPKPPPQKTARLNTSEVTIKTTSSSEQTLVIPEAKSQEQNTTSTATKARLSLEIFSLDSDEEETPFKEPEKPKKKTKKCVNSACSSGSTELQAADSVTAEYYDAAKKKRSFVCQPCADAVLVRKQKLISGIKNMTPLMKLDSSTSSQDLVEISDSESDGEDSEPQEQQQPKEKIGEDVAKFLEENLAAVINDTWKKYKLDDRLKEAQNEINAEILKLEQESKEINQMFDDCQRATDKLRSDLYATFDRRNVEQPSMLIYDTPEFVYMGSDTEDAIPESVKTEIKARMNAKRKLTLNTEVPAKRPAIPLGYAPLETSKPKALELKADDDKDISVVKLSAEAAPADLPPVGELSRPPLRVGMAVYAMKNAFGPWFKGRVMDITPKNGSNVQFTMCRIKFDHKQKNNGKVLPARCIAYAEPAEVRMIIGTRLVALFKDANKRESYYSGVVAEIPNPVNNYRYLVFFDDGYAQYVSHAHTRLVCECSNLVWEEVHPLSREFVREYLMAYPERPMVRLHEGQHLKTEWNGKWWSSRVVRVDASLAQVVFLGDGRREWVYRGSTRLAPLYLELRAAERHRPRPMPRSTQPRSNLLPYVEYTRSVEQPTNKAQETQPVPVALTTQQQTEQEIRRQRAVAKKSTVSAGGSATPVGPMSSGVALPVSVSGPTPAPLDSDNSRVVYYTPKNAVRPYKLVAHTCSPACKRSDVLSLKELRTYNPLAKPLLSGWERQIVRFKGQREVMYRAPCGRRLRSMAELHRYLRLTQSELPVDLFDFYHATHCLAEFVLHKCLVGKKDLSHGKENVPVPCVNCYDESLPEFCSYNTERTPTSGVPLNLDPDFLCGCDCTDDCEDKTKCACWKLTLEGARTIGLDGFNVGYEYKRLPDPLPSGIYECNSRCKCKQTCLNRVAQHPLQLKLQVFKTLKRGWGIRALNDVPKGAFLCVYAGNLLTDATANLDGLNEGDEYLAELDYIEVVEQMKEGYEEDIPDADKKHDKKESTTADDSEEELPSSSEDDENASKTDKEDDDFRPGYVSLGVSGFSKSLRKRSKKKTETKEEKENKGDPEDDCITISDDDEVREPSRFTANPGMAGNDFVSKYRSVRTLFGEDEACYIMDAKVQGNIGRYLNHSCSPNVFVQNVFVDTHDPRFPWVAFFALSHVKAGTELTWNYNYDVGSVPGKVLYCYCEAPNCRGRLL